MNTPTFIQLDTGDVVRAGMIVAVAAIDRANGWPPRTVVEYQGPGGYHVSMHETFEDAVTERDRIVAELKGPAFQPPAEPAPAPSDAPKGGS